MSEADRARADARDALPRALATALVDLDARLADDGVVLRTLDPTAEHRTVTERVARLRPVVLADVPAAASLDGLVAPAIEALLASWRRHFPDNVFFDFDALFARLLREAAEAPTHAERALAFGRGLERLARLDALFGREGSIRFAFVHDLIYGFDWARWVARDPAERAAIGPFDAPFLERMLRRGHELLVLIGRGDAEYPELSPGDGLRNPFAWSRTPHDEARLLRQLSGRTADERDDGEGVSLPIRAWDVRARSHWRPDFERLRNETAHRLGIVAGGGRP